MRDHNLDRSRQTTDEMRMRDGACCGVGGEMLGGRGLRGKSPEIVSYR
jgi:hypothetical protein